MLAWRCSQLDTSRPDRSPIEFLIVCARFRDVELIVRDHEDATESPADTPLWNTLQRVAAGLFPGSATVPLMMMGATDARFFRRAGSVAYGFGLFSQRISYDDYSSMFHGDNERVDQESLRLSTELWDATARDLLSA